MIADGRKRQLVFKSIKMSDSKNYTCKTNADQTKCELIVQCELIETKSTRFKYNFLYQLWGF